MENCNKVVLVVKASEVGERGLLRSLDILKQKNCKNLSLLFVVDHDFFSGAGAGYVKANKTVDEGLEGIADAILRKMEDMIEEQGSDVATERIILHGKTIEEIIKFVKENVVDVLIIPKDKRGPIEKFITGGDIGPFIEELESYVKEVVVVE